jgi:hypothetical protein
MHVQQRSVDGSRKQKPLCDNWQPWAGCRLQIWWPTRTLQRSGSSHGSNSCLQSVVTRSTGDACRWRRNMSRLNTYDSNVYKTLHRQWC